MQPVVFLLVLIALVHIITGCQYSGKAASKQTEFLDSLKEKQIAGSDYYISLPNDFTIKAQDGEDFSVYYLSPADTTAEASFNGGIYFGNHPNLFEAANDSCTTSELNNDVLNQNTAWKVFTCDGKYSIQTIIDSHSNEGWNAKIHLFGHATSEDGIHKMLDIYSTLKIKH